MENNQEYRDAHQMNIDDQSSLIIAQLLQISACMYHIDEMLLWLSHRIAESLNIDVLQFWSDQAHTTGSSSPELRVTASQNPSLPLRVVNNERVAERVGGLLVARAGVDLQPVESAFSFYQADLLADYHLCYWACLFFSSDALLPPPMKNDLSHEAIPTPLTMIVSLFTQQVLHPHLLATITRIVEQALSLARNRELLLRRAHLPRDSAVHHHVQSEQLTLEELIPRWVQSGEAMQANNPLTDNLPTSDGQARRLYFAVDGKKSVAELADGLQFDQQEIGSALHLLLKQKLVRLHDLGGKAVDSSFFFGFQV